MPFPTVPLVVKIELAFGADLHADPATWVYVDRTVDWLASKDLTATIGRADATARPQAAKLGFWLKNPGGKYTKGNAMSPYWPYIRKNTPCRVTLDPGTGNTRVYEMYVTQWIPRWGSDGASGRQPLVQVVANGVRRRLSQGATPLRSPLYRALSTLKPLAYWTLEDGSDATQAGSALTGGTPLVANGTIKFGSLTDTPGAERAPEIINGTLSGVCPAGVSTSGWSAHVAVRAEKVDPSIDSNAYAISWQSANGYTWSFAVFDLNSGLAGHQTWVTGGRSRNPLDGSDDLSVGVSTVNVLDGKWHSLTLAVNKTGTTSCSIDLWVDSVHAVNTAANHKYSPLIGTILGPNEAVNTTRNMKTLSISHFGLIDAAITPGNLPAATQGYAGEQAGPRIARLCAEQGVAAVVSAGATTRMGPQRPGQFLALLDECEAADGGILLNGLSPGFNYLARVDAYNLPVALTIDMAGRQFKAPFEPLDDDSQLVNDETISRVNGSSATYIDKTGPAGTDAIERYDDSRTLNLYSDSDLLAQAAWRTGIGTAGADKLRFPIVGFDLHTAAGSALIESWLTSGVRRRVQATHPPAEYGPGPIDLLVEGYTEKVRSRRVWSVAANTSPYDPWRVAVIGQDRVDSANSTVRTTVPAGAASVQVDVGTVLWTTNPAKLPAGGLDMNIDGIKVRVTAISGVTSPQTLTLDPATVVKPLVAGRPVRLWTPAVVAL